MERSGRVVTRSQLESLVYDGDASNGSNTMALFVHQLRRKLGDEIITTVHGQGYMVSKEDR
jgi:two-component system OmpR family response regulator